MRSAYDPLLDHAAIFGQTLVNHLTDRSDHPVLVDGRHRYSRHDLVMRFKTGNIHAARNLQRVMDRLKFKTIRELFQIPGALLAEERGFGPTTLYVLVAIGEEYNVNITKWWNYGVTLDTLKNRIKKRDVTAAEETRAATSTRQGKQRRILKSAATRTLKRSGARTNGSGVSATLN